MPREIIRLKFSSVSTHEIARRLGMARSTVRETLKRADEVANTYWPQLFGKKPDHELRSLQKLARVS
jgi:IS30 family transposase